MKIEVFAKVVLDSRKQKTIEISANREVTSAPAGKSTGKYEAKSYRTDVEGDIKVVNSLDLDLFAKTMNNQLAEKNNLVRLISADYRNKINTQSQKPKAATDLSKKDRDNIIKYIKTLKSK